MESSEDVEVLSRAIEKLLVEKRTREAAGDSFIEDEDDQLLLTRLVSQLESPNPFQKTLVTTKEEEEEPSPDSSPSKGKQEGSRQLEERIEEIAKDIKEVKRQNKVTHLLLSALIILTLTWQLSEYSMIYMMKERLSHPIRSISGMLSGMFKGKLGPIKNRFQGTSKDENNLHNGNGSSNNGVHIQMPELLREFGFDDDDQ